MIFTIILKSAFLFLCLGEEGHFILTSSALFGEMCGSVTQYRQGLIMVHALADGPRCSRSWVNGSTVSPPGYLAPSGKAG